jgi:hypothetical protein
MEQALSNPQWPLTLALALAPKVIGPQHCQLGSSNRSTLSKGDGALDGTAALGLKGMVPSMESAFGRR